MGMLGRSVGYCSGGVMVYCMVVWGRRDFSGKGGWVVLAVLKPERLKADRARRLLISVLIFIVYEEESKVESCPSEIILDDLLALDSIMPFDFGDRRLEQTATFSISTNSDSSSISVGTLPLFSLFSFLIFPKDFYSNLEDCPWQSSIIEFVYLVEAHHHLNPIFIPKDNIPRRPDDGVVMLVLQARGRPLRFGEVHLSLVALNPKVEVFYALSYNQLFGPLVDGRSENLLVFRWEVVQVTLKV
uniref:Uncharacterized protein n=1 Tax=Tanacetum cinerariifolium TaxID=118510 RepID=A0A6L2JPN7_TANCI|nr:hypothetical protein [Tanacetum cinerariifolium]